MTVPVCEANNNFGIVRKRFYLKVIEKEIGISDDGNISDNKVYRPICQKAEDIYQFHENELLSTFDIKLLDENQKMTPLYWSSKQH